MYYLNQWQIHGLLKPPTSQERDTLIFVSEQNGVLLLNCHKTAGKKTFIYYFRVCECLDIEYIYDNIYVVSCSEPARAEVWRMTGKCGAARAPRRSRQVTVPSLDSRPILTVINEFLLDSKQCSC